MYKKRNMVLGLILLSCSVLLNAGCKKEEQEVSGPNFETVAYVGGNIYFEIPSTWAHIAMEGRQDILVFAQQENRIPDGYNNVTVQVLSTTAQETPATMEELQAAFSASFEAAVKAQIPEAREFTYSQFEENGIPVFTATFVGMTTEKEFQQTVMYPVLPQGQIVISASKSSTEAPDPETVARHMIRSLQIGPTT